MIRNAAPKYVPLTIISILGNLTPMVCVILAFFMLKEKLKKAEFIAMCGILVCIIVIIVGGKDDNQEEGSENSKLSVEIMYVLLTLSAFGSAGGTIAMRKMKKFHESTVPWYSNWVSLICSILIMLCFGQSFTYLFSLDFYS